MSKMSEEELRTLLEDSGWKFYEELNGWRKESKYTVPMFSADQSTNYDELSAGNYYELVKAIKQYTLSKQIEELEELVHGRDTYVSSRLIKEHIAELRKQQEELK